MNRLIPAETLLCKEEAVVVFPLPPSIEIGRVFKALLLVLAAPPTENGRALEALLLPPLLLLLPLPLLLLLLLLLLLWLLPGVDTE